MSTPARTGAILLTATDDYAIYEFVRTAADKVGINWTAMDGRSSGVIGGLYFNVHDARDHINRRWVIRGLAPLQYVE